MVSLFKWHAIACELKTKLPDLNGITAVSPVIDLTAFLAR